MFKDKNKILLKNKYINLITLENNKKNLYYLNLINNINKKNNNKINNIFLLLINYKKNNLSKCFYQILLKNKIYKIKIINFY